MNTERIWLIILLLTIILIVSISYFYLKCVVSKLRKNKQNDIYESLLVSPSNLYTTNNKIHNICNVKHKSELGNKPSYITIDMLMKIKNIDPQKRLGSELVGYKLRMELPKYNIENISNIYDEEQDTYDYDKLVNEESEIIKKIISSEQNYDLHTQDDYIVEKDNYNKCANNMCWYNVTVINHIYIKPINIHKISWTNRFGEQETKWTNLNLHNIQVPIKPYVKSMIRTLSPNISSPYSFKDSVETKNLNKIIDHDYYYEHTELDDNCNNYFNKNNILDIKCSTDNECAKYGSYLCDSTKHCNTLHMNIQ